MSNLGQQLKEARLARGLSLDDVQDMTKIRKRYLEAIEAGDYKVLPGSFYVRAFIKTYAETVGVNADELLNEHRQDVPAPQVEQTMEPVLQKRRSRQTSERNSKWMSTALMWSFAILILIVIYMYFAVWGKNPAADRNNETDPTKLTQSENPSKQGDKGQNGASNGDSQGANDANQPDTDGGNAPAGTDGNQTDTGSPDGAENGSGLNSGAGTDSSGDIVVQPDGKSGSTTNFKVINPGGQPVQVVINATGKSWVEVYKGGRDGEKLYFDNTSDGDVLTYELGPEGMYIKSGASSYTEITVAGQVVEDGKNTSKIQLSMDTTGNGAGAGLDSTDTDTE
ncbi:RodZ family helix-turn-helix domain-containing protein [Paenibacillus woosongensis]|uniref:Helix-turn-helix domain-containing protein n=1 Tax=Paenibacillus woosongensis TaxID=307580 RepID=A0A7X3CMW7_9BACL|nr:RodZ family helix-turn-helix domain-containing protein [Paenibacillus woosongensis]MUG45625.1 helix-turn-helix domain-containing protein [Paenibacillus woosongensis]